MTFWTVAAAVATPVCSQNPSAAASCQTWRWCRPPTRDSPTAFARSPLSDPKGRLECLASHFEYDAFGVKRATSGLLGGDIGSEAGILGHGEA